MTRPLSEVREGQDVRWDRKKIRIHLTGPVVI